MKSRRFSRLALWALLGCTAALGVHWGFSIQSQQRFADLIAAPSAGAASGRLMTEKETTLRSILRKNPTVCY